MRMRALGAVLLCLLASVTVTFAQLGTQEPGRDTGQDSAEDASKESTAKNEDGKANADEGKTYPEPDTPLPHVEKMGTGDTHIILIPDLLFDERQWTPFMERNADKYTMHAVVLPGQSGTLAPPFYDFSVENLVELPYMTNARHAIIKYMKDEGIDSAYFVGDNFGGKMVFRMAVEHPELVKGGISLNGVPLTIVACLTTDLTLEQRANCQLDTFLPRLETRDESLWARRTAMSVSSSIDDPERAAELSEIAELQDKRVYLRYWSEGAVQADKIALTTLDVPLTLIANISVHGIPPSMKLETLRARRSVTCDGAKNTEVVFFEEVKQYMLESASEEVDAAVEAMINGEPIKGIPRTGADPDPTVAPGDLPDVGDSPDDRKRGRDSR